MLNKFDIKLDSQNFREYIIGSGFKSGEISMTASDVHYVMGGNGKKAIIFLHGFSENWFAFRHLMQLLAVDYTVVAIDLPGIGRSESKTKQYDSQGHAEVIRALLHELHIDRPYIVGHDMGGMVAYTFARLYPNKVSGVAVLDAPLPGTPSTDLMVKLPFLWHFTLHRLPYLPEKIIHGREYGYFTKAFFNRFMKNKDAIDDEEIRHYAHAYARLGQLKAGFGLYRAYRKDRNFMRDNRNEFKVPLLVMESDFGSTDPGPTAKQLREQFGCSNVDAVVIQGAGHYLPEESPEAIVELIRKAYN